jgi:hypothetical protein
LIGDAFHALIPHIAMVSVFQTTSAGNFGLLHYPRGGNSALEDAACLAEALDWAFHSGKDVSLATQAFEHLRKPRVERMQRGGHEGYAFLGAKGDFLPIRDAAVAEATKAYDADVAVPEEVRRSRSKPGPDMSERFPLEVRVISMIPVSDNNGLYSNPELAFPPMAVQLRCCCGYETVSFGVSLRRYVRAQAVTY